LFLPRDGVRVWRTDETHPFRNAESFFDFFLTILMKTDSNPS
jgi:hypothetical protein